MRIMVVDDDALAGELTAAVLESAGHEVVLVENGIEALEKFGEDRAFAMVVSDMNMPLVSGIELFRHLRDANIDIPFILLTGDDPAPMMAEEPRLDVCLTKDASLEISLIEAIEAANERRRRA
ncbi:response regulator [Telmatospirillum sp.]|uniref:response regulator n=1 Tax=Telmatospirillum sp. TaxID=2079197 RepID=UPI00283E49D9|nr:response regulator [Telmatospirillum sp.]MDR3437363.1 response regulator [Telmatospirillum sp.]